MSTPADYRKMLAVQEPLTQRVIRSARASIESYYQRNPERRPPCCVRVGSVGCQGRRIASVAPDGITPSEPVSLAPRQTVS